MEGLAGIVWQVAHRLHPPKPMGKKRGAGIGVCRPCGGRPGMSPSFSPDATAVKAHPDAHGALKKRRAADRQDTGRPEHQGPRCGGLRHRHCRISAVRRERTGCGCGTDAAGKARAEDDGRRSCNGSGLFRRPYADDSAVTEAQPRSSAETEPQKALDAR